jgi:hypothetical protein
MTDVILFSDDWANLNNHATYSENANVTLPWDVASPSIIPGDVPVNAVVSYSNLSNLSTDVTADNFIYLSTGINCSLYDSSEAKRFRFRTTIYFDSISDESPTLTGQPPADTTIGDQLTIYVYDALTLVGQPYDDLPTASSNHIIATYTNPRGATRLINVDIPIPPEFKSDDMRYCIRHHNCTGGYRVFVGPIYVTFVKPGVYINDVSYSPSGGTETPYFFVTASNQTTSDVRYDSLGLEYYDPETGTFIPYPYGTNDASIASGDSAQFLITLSTDMRPRISMYGGLFRFSYTNSVLCTSPGSAKRLLMDSYVGLNNGNSVYDYASISQLRTSSTAGYYIFTTAHVDDYLSFANYSNGLNVAYPSNPNRLLINRAMYSSETVTRLFSMPVNFTFSFVTKTLTANTLEIEITIQYLGTDPSRSTTGLTCLYLLIENHVPGSSGEAQVNGANGDTSTDPTDLDQSPPLRYAFEGSPIAATSFVFRDVIRASNSGDARGQSVTFVDGVAKLTVSFNLTADPSWVRDELRTVCAILDENGQVLDATEHANINDIQLPEPQIVEISIDGSSKLAVFKFDGVLTKPHIYTFEYQAYLASNTIPLWSSTMIGTIEFMAGSNIYTMRIPNNFIDTDLYANEIEFTLDQIHISMSSTPDVNNYLGGPVNFFGTGVLDMKIELYHSVPVLRATKSIVGLPGLIEDQDSVFSLWYSVYATPPKKSTQLALRPMTLKYTRNDLALRTCLSLVPELSIDVLLSTTPTVSEAIISIRDRLAPTAPPVTYVYSPGQLIDISYEDRSTGTMRGFLRFVAPIPASLALADSIRSSATVSTSSGKSKPAPIIPTIAIMFPTTIAIDKQIKTKLSIAYKITISAPTRVTSANQDSLIEYVPKWTSPTIQTVLKKAAFNPLAIITYYLNLQQSANYELIPDLAFDDKITVELLQHPTQQSPFAILSPEWSTLAALPPKLKLRVIDRHQSTVSVNIAPLFALSISTKPAGLLISMPQRSVVVSKNRLQLRYSRDVVWRRVSDSATTSVTLALSSMKTSVVPIVPATPTSTPDEIYMWIKHQTNESLWSNFIFASLTQLSTKPNMLQVSITFPSKTRHFAPPAVPVGLSSLLAFDLRSVTTDAPIPIVYVNWHVSTLDVVFAAPITKPPFSPTSAKLDELQLLASSIFTAADV